MVLLIFSPTSSSEGALARMAQVLWLAVVGRRRHLSMATVVDHPREKVFATSRHVMDGLFRGAVLARPGHVAARRGGLTGTLRLNRRGSTPATGKKTPISVSSCKIGSEHIGERRKPIVVLIRETLGMRGP